MLTDATTQLSVNTIRVLAAEGVEKAKSGHPGMPLGCADFAFVLWYKYLRHNPTEPQWLGRDRFVLSAGHGSMLLYSLLHLFGYDLTIEDLKQFRQWESKTPGHPEHGMTPGVEVTTGPLGTGFASAVGLAVAAKQLGARLGNPALFDQRIFAISGDGCMMEGITSEAASFAGHQKLDNLVVFYDDNQITIEGSTALAFSENVGQRFEAYGWNVLRINGQDLTQIDQALSQAVAMKNAPTLIIGRTTIAYGAPTKAGSHSAHGEPLGEKELQALKQAFGFPLDKSFYVPDAVRDLFAKRVTELRAGAQAWDAQLATYSQANPEKANLLQQLTQRTIPANLLEELLKAIPAKENATRNSGGDVLQKLSALIPAVTGGAADLNPSTKTHVKAEADFSPDARHGRNIHFGVREFAMGQIANGMALYGTAIPYTATFAVFSDFMKPAMRLAAIQEINVIFVFTHDSIFVGEDGPTHEPIEQIAMCRSIPGMTVLRPADSYEVAHAWATAVQVKGPVAMFLTRQNVENVPSASVPNVSVSKGAYVLSDEPGFEAIMIATGSELMTTYRAVEQLRKSGQKIRLVSMPSWELFLKQSDAYRESVLPKACAKRVTIEAGTTFGWARFAGLSGLCIGIDHFGASAPYKVLAEKYGFTSEAIAARTLAYLSA